jgi:hypothetical protein
MLTYNALGGSLMGNKLIIGGTRFMSGLEIFVIVAERMNYLR